MHDLRYVRNRPKKQRGQNKFPEPITTLAGHKNVCTERLPFSSLPEGSLVSMAGDDNVVRIWDLKGTMTPGMGLKPTEIRRTLPEGSLGEQSNSSRWVESVGGLAFFDDRPVVKSVTKFGQSVEATSRGRPVQSPFTRVTDFEFADCKDIGIDTPEAHRGLGLIVAHGPFLTMLGLDHQNQ